MATAIETPQLRGPGPWLIPATTSAEARRAILQQLAAAGVADPALQRVAATLRAACSGCDAAARARLALWWVQHSLPWRDEGADKEVYERVGTTLAGGEGGRPLGGNCHDYAPSLVALLAALGVPGALVTWVSQPGSPKNHVTVQVPVNGVWTWAESTLPNARLGEDPYEAERALAGTHDRAAIGADGARLPPASGQGVVTAIVPGGPKPTAGLAAPAPAPRPRTTAPAPLAHNAMLARIRR